MKKFYSYFALVLTLLFLSCQKNSINFPKEKPENLLTSVTWMIKEITFVQDNNLYHYLRGGQNNTADFTTDYLTFRRDKSGTYVAGPHSYELTWEFTDEEKTKLQYTIYNYSDGAPASGSNTIVKLENVNLSRSTFRYAEIYTNTNQKSTISSVERIPMASIK